MRCNDYRIYVYHLLQAEFVAEFSAHRHTDQSLGFTCHEIYIFLCRKFCRTDQIAFVLSVRIINDQNYFPSLKSCNASSTVPISFAIFLSSQDHLKSVLFQKVFGYSTFFFCFCRFFFRCWLQQFFHIFSNDVTFQIYDIPDLPVMQRRYLLCMRDDGHFKAMFIT